MRKPSKRLMKRHWTKSEIERLDKWTARKPVDQIAAVLGRTPSAVRQKMVEMNLSIRDRKLVSNPLGR